MESVKKFWSASPCNVRHSRKEIGTREYFDEVEAKKYFVEPHIPSFAEFEKWKGKKVLEIGCGLGTETVNFARAGAQVTAVDISEKSLELAQKRAEVYGLSVRFLLANAEELSSVLDPSEKFDLIWSFGVIHHSPHPENVIEQLSQYLLPGGELRIMLYSLVSYKAMWAMHEHGPWNMSTMRDTIRHWAEAQSGCPYAYVYSFSDIEDLLSPYFTVQKIWKDHIFTWNIPDYVEGRYVKDPAWEGMTDEELRKLEKELGWHTLVKAVRL